MARASVKILHAGLEMHEENGKQQTVLRGILDPDSLDQLQIAPYQREVLPRTTVQSLIEPIKSGRIPDIVLGARGSQLVSREDAYFVPAEVPVYVIDGQQRREAARFIRKQEPDFPLKLGVLIFFNTTEDDERRLFLALNTKGTKLSPSVVIRDLAPDYPVITPLIDLTTDNKNFVGYGKFCWNQHMTSGQLMTARSLVILTSLLHENLGGPKSSDMYAVAAGLQKVGDLVGVKQLVENVVTFYEVIDECCGGLKYVRFKQTATQVKSNFQNALARVFSTFPEFWMAPTNKAAKAGLNSKLVVGKNRRDKLKSFPLDDPEVIRLSGAGASTLPMLYMLLLEHLNRGTRSKRLVDRSMTELITADEQAGGEE